MRRCVSHQIDHRPSAYLLQSQIRSILNRKRQEDTTREILKLLTHADNPLSRQSINVSNFASPSGEDSIFKLIWQPILSHRAQFFPRNELKDSLKASLPLHEAKDVVVLGDPGAGKTRLVNEFQHVHCREKYRVLVSITAETENAFRNGLIRIARTLFSSPGQVSINDDNLLEMLQSFMKTNDDWFMAIDNLGDSNLLRMFIPVERKGGHVVIITRPGRGFSRNSASCRNPTDIDLSVHSLIEIGNLTDAEGASFLLWHSGLRHYHDQLASEDANTKWL